MGKTDRTEPPPKVGLPDVTVGDDVPTDGVSVAPNELPHIEDIFGNLDRLIDAATHSSTNSSAVPSQDPPSLSINNNDGGATTQSTSNNNIQEDVATKKDRVCDLKLQLKRAKSNLECEKATNLASIDCLKQEIGSTKKQLKAANVMIDAKDSEIAGLIDDLNTDNEIHKTAVRSLKNEIAANQRSITSLQKSKLSLQDKLNLEKNKLATKKKEFKEVSEANTGYKNKKLEKDVEREEKNIKTFETKNLEHTERMEVLKLKGKETELEKTKILNDNREHSREASEKMEVTKLKARAMITEITKTFDKKRKVEMEQDSLRETYQRLAGCATNAACIPVVEKPKKKRKNRAASKANKQPDDAPTPGQWPTLNCDMMKAVQHITTAYPPPAKTSGDDAHGTHRSRMYQETIESALQRMADLAPPSNAPPPLPPGWVQMVDPVANRPYYFNPITRGCKFLLQALNSKPRAAGTAAT